MCNIHKQGIHWNFLYKYINYKYINKSQINYTNNYKYTNKKYTDKLQIYIYKYINIFYLVFLALYLWSNMSAIVAFEKFGSYREFILVYYVNSRKLRKLTKDLTALLK